MMHDFSKVLTFVSDPEHGWLEVPLTDIAVLGIEGQISPSSYISGRFAYLEEDCDYAVYMDALAARGLPRPEIRQRYMKQFNRSQPGFGDRQFAAEFWDKLRR
jgi:hypothetical protein